MVEEITLRPAKPADFGFCQRTYFEPMRATINELGLDEANHLANFASRWEAEQVRMVMINGQVIGWLQTAPTDDALFLAQLFIDTRFQRRGIGSRLMRILIEEAAHENKAVTLGVVKTNPARRLYERLGFGVAAWPDLPHTRVRSQRINSALGIHAASGMCRVANFSKGTPS